MNIVNHTPQSGPIAGNPTLVCLGPAYLFGPAMLLSATQIH